ncbi:MAG: hypothetical protein WBB73_17190 [Candidatus Aminicenantaceae bacterium]
MLRFIKTRTSVRLMGILFCLIGLMASGMELRAQWVRVYGFSSGRFYPNVFIKAPDGGYIMAGDYYSRFASGWLWKLSDSCELEWTQTIASTEDVAVASEGGYITAGYGGLTKLDENGEWEWNLRFDGEFTSVKQTAELGYIAVGRIFKQYNRRYKTFLLMLTASRETVWTKRINDDECVISKLLLTEDGGFLALANIGEDEPGQQDACLLKLSTEGAIQWQNIYGGTDEDELVHFSLTSDGSFVATGRTRSFGQGGDDIWVMKILPDGEIEWQKTFGEVSDEYGSFVQQTGDGGYLVCGTAELPGNSTMLILKLSGDGTIEWRKAFSDGEGRTYSGEMGHMFLEEDDGSILAAGGTDSMGGDSTGYYPPYRILILRLTASGELPGCRYISVPQLATSDSTALPRPAYYSMKNFTITFRSYQGSDYLAPPEISEICPQGKGSKLRR